MNVDFRDGYIDMGDRYIYARFGESKICVVFAAKEPDPDFGKGYWRPAYAYLVMTSDNTVIDSGEDLHGPLNGEPNMMEAFSTLLSFYGNDADCYAARMAGSALEEWAYNNEDEIYELKDAIDSMK
ncbi:MAG TPA: hypothetical protein VIY48_14235 [Candidatus Paceibacterota bacterium]